MTTWPSALSTSAAAVTPSCFLQQFFFERSRVHADPDGDALFARGFEDPFHAVHGSDIAGIDPDFVRAPPDRFEREPVVEMNVGHERNTDLRFLISPTAFASSMPGTATRTISHPAFSSRRICFTVALTSAVLVVVMDWTVIGESPPIATGPTWTGLDFRR